MFGFGREGRTRREAKGIIRAAIQVDAHRQAALQAQVGLAPKFSVADHDSLAAKLIERVSGSSLDRFAGHRLIRLSGTGLAMEALLYGLDELDARPDDQRLITSALGLVLRAANERKDQLNGADYEMLHVVAERYVNHPAVVEMTRPPAERPAA